MDDWTNTRLYYVEEGDYPDNTRGTFWLNATGSDEMNMGNVGTLDWYLNLVTTNFPADHYFLSMWDHNWGWHAGWFEEDETNNATMDYSDLAVSTSALPRVIRRLGLDLLSKIDVVGYDACVSAQIEVLHTWQPYANTFAGSQDYVGYGGVAYDVVIGAIQANPLIDPSELAAVIAESILTDPDDGCASAFKLDDSFSALVVSVDSLAKAMIANIDEIRDQLVAIRHQTPQTPAWVSDDFHRDLYSMASAIASEFALSEFHEVAAAAANVTTSFDAGLIYNRVVDKRSCEGGRGLTIYWPRSLDKPSNDYYRTSFALSTAWDEFLDIF